MSNDELKKKFIKIIRQGFADADCRRPYTNVPYPYFDSQIFCIADALIAAGIGDVAALTDKWREMLRVQAEKTEQAERRARIAEFALYRSFGPHSYGFELQRAEQILSESGELAEEKKEP